MSVWAAVIGGLAGTLVLTSILRAASELRLTRVDLPFLLGTAVTTDRQRAKLVGYLLHLVPGSCSRWRISSASSGWAAQVGSSARCSA